MNRWYIKSSILSLLIYLLAFVPPVRGQYDSSASEVYLSFQYRGIVSSYVITYYKDEQFYLPVNELFNLLKVHHQVNQGKLSISGNFLGNKEFTFDFKNFTVHAGDVELRFRADDFIIGQMDYFVKPFVFEQLFGLEFKVDFNTLTLRLQTKDKMPVVVKYRRKQNRERLNRKKPVYARSYSPLKYPRNYSALDGAFLDYNLSAVYTGDSRLFTFSNALGAEFLGGDVQGNIYGALSAQQSTFTTAGLRWRFVQRNNDYFSSLVAGQTHSEGIAGRSFTGIKITNKPVEPRLLFDRYVIDGSVPAQSEVELYLNNRLVDFQKADAAGNYRFLVPLTYGSTNYSVRIFTPSGQAYEQNSRIHIPFDYLPPGEVDYTLSGGRLHNPILGETDRGYIGEASLSTGITNWLTAKASAEYLTNYHSSLPSFTGTINARLFSNYLISANFNSENFYRFSSSVVYGNGASWSASYDYNPGSSKLYSIGRYDHRGLLNIFMPFKIGPLPLNVRWSSVYQRTGPNQLLRYRADLSTRLGRLNIRFGYQDQQAGNLSLVTTPVSLITNSYTYALGRYHSVPGLIRGMFLRGQLSYLPGIDELESMELQISRDFLNTGRVQLSFGHNFLRDFSSFSLNFTIDFNNFRSNSTARIIDSGASFTQGFRGSIAYDPYGSQFMLTNRQQVGQSGAAVRLFVDKNNDGSYQEAIDRVIDEPAVRLDRAAGRTGVKNGINYISRLRPYYRYDIEINRSALDNPLLVPAVENFSIVTDPNQYKAIEIPFYLSGVISGKVERKGRGLSGVRLYLQSVADSSSGREVFSKELHTFSDGSFYAYEIPPGRYDLYIDRGQLAFLDAVSQPDTLQITVEALALGDFVENLRFAVRPKADQPSREGNIIAGEDSNQSYYQIQLGSFSALKRAQKFKAKIAQQIDEPLRVIYNVANGLYAVRTLPVISKNKARETISVYYETGKFTDAALVVLNNDPKRYSISKRKFVQIGAFSTRKRALAFVSSSAPKLKKEVLVSFNEEIDLYKVLINNAEGLSTSELRGFLTKVRSMDSFGDAFIYKDNIKGFSSSDFRQREMEFSYQIEIANVTTTSERLIFDLLKKYTGLIVKHADEHSLQVKIGTWKGTVFLQKELRKIAEIHPVIVLIEKRAGSDDAIVNYSTKSR
ncbi:MAG TPA: SPOR domain-containing protein [Balneolaceae bacterium]|nr:SPOR domain-containing protein [Balneolaceae bacterium]